MKPKGGKMNGRQEIVNKIKELEKEIIDSKEEATAKEMSEYLILINKLQARLSVMTEEIIENKEEGGDD